MNIFKKGARAVIALSLLVVLFIQQREWNVKHTQDVGLTVV